MYEEWSPEERSLEEIRESVYGECFSDVHIGDYDHSITRPTVSFARKCVVWSRDRKIYETASRKRLAEFSSNPYFRYEYPEIPRHWPGTWAVITNRDLKGVVGRLSRPSTARPRTAPLHTWLRERYKTQRAKSAPMRLPTVIVRWFVRDNAIEDTMISQIVLPSIYHIASLLFSGYIMSCHVIKQWLCGISLGSAMLSKNDL